MSVISREDAIKALEDVGVMYPYRIPGVTETYRPYNEAWNDAIDEAEKAIEALPDADDGWISVKDRPPEEERWVYFMETEKDVEIAWYAGGWFKTNNDLAWTDSADCLYWKYISIPKPYKPKEDK